jgi:hypothetical protein
LGEIASVRIDHTGVNSLGGRLSGNDDHVWGEGLQQRVCA